MRKKSVTQAALVGTVAVVGLGTHASVGATARFDIDDTRWVSLGAGVRTSFNSVEDAAPSGDDRSKDFRLDNVRLYVNGQIHDYVKMTFNTERQAGPGDDDIRVLDAIGRFEFNKSFNIWGGRFLPPSDRSNLDGPFYLNSWTFPIIQAYPAVFAGRDDGVAVWGASGSGMFKYQAGAFDGTESVANDEDDLLYAGRLTLNLWDPEPGYYNASTYYGEKDVLALGLAAMSQQNGTGTAANPGDFTGWNADLLVEKVLSGGGVVSLEGAYYDYDHDDTQPAFGYQGEGYSALVAYMLPTKIGIGQFQPYLRFQDKSDDNGSDVERFEAGLKYVIEGHDAHVSLVYGNDSFEQGQDSNFAILGLQLQI